MCDPGEGSVCIAGVGRWYRQDDQVGLTAAGALAERSLPGVAILATESPCTDIPAALGHSALLIVVDAASADEAHPAGTWQRIDYRRSPDRLRERPRACDTHSLGVASALQLAEEMDLLPPEIWVYAIAVGCVEPGDGLSREVEAAMHAVVEAIPTDLLAWRSQHTNRPCTSSQ
jgi:hydrogenase maturation protease